jgi:hypothetical protein
VLFAARWNLTSHGCLSQCDGWTAKRHSIIAKASISTFCIHMKFTRCAVTYDRLQSGLALSSRIQPYQECSSPVLSFIRSGHELNLHEYLTQAVAEIDTNIIFVRWVKHSHLQTLQINVQAWILTSINYIMSNICYDEAYFLIKWYSICFHFMKVVQKKKQRTTLFRSLHELNC